MKNEIYLICIPNKFMSFIIIGKQYIVNKYKEMVNKTLNQKYLILGLK